MLRERLAYLLLRLDAMRDVALWRGELPEYSRSEKALWRGQAHGLQIAAEELAEAMGYEDAT